MKLEIAKLCSECDEIFVGTFCPKCGYTYSMPVSQWIPSQIVKSMQRSQALQTYRPAQMTTAEINQQEIDFGNGN